MPQIEIEIPPDELDAIGRVLRAVRANGASMKQLAAFMRRRWGIVCTPSTVFAIMTLAAPPGRANWAPSRDPGKKGGRNPRRRSRWYSYPRTIGRKLR